MNRQQRFKHFRSVTFFGWSESRPGDAVYEAARETARLLAGQGLTVVSGGFGGEMEAAARGAREGGGKAIGVTFYRSHSEEYAYPPGGEEGLPYRWFSPRSPERIEGLRSEVQGLTSTLRAPDARARFRPSTLTEAICIALAGKWSIG